jgi:hypothetical protein
MSDLIKPSDPASRKARVQTRLSGTSDALLYGNAVTRKTSAMRAQAEFSATTDAESDGMAVWRAMLSILRMFRDDETATSKNICMYATASPCAPKSISSSGQRCKNVCCSVIFSSIERAGPGRLLVSWHEATIGKYSEQRWLRCVSRSRGVCALSGKPVRRGDIVYRPSTRSALKPVNIGAMILETSIDAHLSAVTKLPTEAG